MWSDGFDLELVFNVIIYHLHFIDVISSLNLWKLGLGYELILNHHLRSSAHPHRSLHLHHHGLHLEGWIWLQRYEFWLTRLGLISCQIHEFRRGLLCTILGHVCSGIDRDFKSNLRRRDARHLDTLAWALLSDLSKIMRLRASHSMLRNTSVYFPLHVKIKCGRNVLLLIDHRSG